ncbi:MAG TPA: PAS domain S-box protein [Dongiaceae bacterium]|jgi:PAS domain S-box-containing protein|nr:PAS domain S-box protein [Dongiaceae bacterium]
MTTNANAPMLAETQEPILLDENAGSDVKARLLATVLRESNDAITMLSLDGRIVSWNRKAELLYGYSEADVAGLDFRRVIPDEGGAIQQLLDRARRGELLREAETRRLSGDGRAVDLWLTAALLKDDQGEPRAIAITERDITDRKRNEREMEERVVRRTDELAIMHEVAARSNEAHSMDDLMAFCLERICLHNDWPFGHGYFVDRDGSKDLIPCAGWYGKPKERLRTFHEYAAQARVDVPGNLVQRVIDRGKAEWTTDVEADFPRSVSAMTSQLDFHTVLAFPALVSGEVVAVLEFFSNHIDLPGAGITDLMNSLGTQIANAMERESLRRKLLELTDSEEERLAKDLHDAVGQELAGLLMSGESIFRKMREHQDPKAEGLGDVVHGLRSVLVEIRLLARGLGRISAGPGALTQMLEHLAMHSKVPCELDLDPEVVIKDPAVATHLYRIGQEALALAAKHSEASQAVLRLSQGPDAVTLEIEDDGRSSSEESSLGMRIMKQRSRLIGAALRLESNGGTRIVCTLPRDH